METKTRKQQDNAVSNDIVIYRVFQLRVSKVWKAITDAEYFKKWWGPEGYSCPYSTMEARKGGRYLNCMRGPDGKESWSTGIVQEFIPEKKLLITDSFADAKGNIISANDAGLPGKWP